MGTTRLGLTGASAAYPPFLAKALSPSCLVPAYREVKFDPATGLVTVGFLMQVFTYDGSGLPAKNPDSASLSFDSAQPWATTQAAIIATVQARALEFGISLRAQHVIMHLPPIERG